MILNACCRNMINIRGKTFYRFHTRLIFFVSWAMQKYLIFEQISDSYMDILKPIILTKYGK